MTSTATVLAGGDDDRAKTDRARFGDRDLRDGVADRLRELVRLRFGVVALDLFLGALGDRFQQRAAVVAELAADLADHLVFVLASDGGGRCTR